MKSFIFTVIIFSLLIAAIVVNSFFVRKNLGEISALSSSLTVEFCESDTQRIKNLWQEKRNFLSYSIETDELERMNDLIECLVSTDASASPEEFKKYCRLISDLSEELSDYERISLSSIF